jgi:hypothetical protein
MAMSTSYAGAVVLAACMTTTRLPRAEVATPASDSTAATS